VATSDNPWRTTYKYCNHSIKARKPRDFLEPLISYELHRYQDGKHNIHILCHEQHIHCTLKRHLHKCGVDEIKWLEKNDTPYEVDKNMHLNLKSELIPAIYGRINSIYGQTNISLAVEYDLQGYKEERWQAMQYTHWSWPIKLYWTIEKEKINIKCVYRSDFKTGGVVHRINISTRQKSHLNRYQAMFRQHMQYQINCRNLTKASLCRLLGWFKFNGT